MPAAMPTPYLRYGLQKTVRQQHNSRQALIGTRTYACIYRCHVSGDVRGLLVVGVCCVLCVAETSSGGML